VTIAVDSFGPVTDNAQSVYELSQIEQRPGIAAEIEEQYGFKPDFEHAIPISSSATSSPAQGL
jgi:K(+)-stimulated pyrophosphate-energized sodium pump